MASRLFSLIGIVVLAAAGLVGLIMLRTSEPAEREWGLAMATAQEFQDRAFQAHRAGDPAAAIGPLGDYLEYLEGLEPLSGTWQAGQSPWLDAQTLASERMLTAGRLAAALEQTGASAEAEQLWEKALGFALQTGQPGVSLDTVREAVSRSDDGVSQSEQP
jgi:fermentation-respiration switch protein FrsA (DUF1100 family)